MNKKVKWSVISVSTITALTFGSLVMNNEKSAGNENSGPENDWLRENLSAFSEEGYDDEGDRYYREHDDDEYDDEYYEDHDDDDDEGYDDDDYDDHYRGEYQERGTSWGQDQIVNAPERGFRQKKSSSRTSR
ncbi:hypothetical protein [Mesobacillus thioparans]|uniref:hypothetical protein n=1 Tax=Mesobacillus thioparans TaxID=370439 RepID=UPI0039EF776F